MYGTMEQLLVDARRLCDGEVVSTSRMVDALLDVRNATDRALIHLKTDIALSLIRRQGYLLACDMRKILDEIDACWQLDPVFTMYDAVLAARDETASES